MFHWQHVEAYLKQPEELAITFSFFHREYSWYQIVFNFAFRSHLHRYTPRKPLSLPFKNNVLYRSLFFKDYFCD